MRRLSKREKNHNNSAIFIIRIELVARVFSAASYDRRSTVHPFSIHVVGDMWTVSITFRNENILHSHGQSAIAIRCDLISSSSDGNDTPNFAKLLFK